MTSPLSPTNSKLEERLVDFTGSYETFGGLHDAVVSATQTINKDLMDIVGEDEDNYRPYLVVAHKLGIEANQTQARLVAAAVNHYKKELRKAIQDYMGGGSDE